MAASVLISQNVIKTIQSLPEEERCTIVSAIAAELILGHDVRDSLSPFENLIFTMISNNVQRDSARYERAKAG